MDPDADFKTDVIVKTLVSVMRMRIIHRPRLALAYFSSERSEVPTT